MGTYKWKPFTLLVSAEEVENKMTKFNVGDRVRYLTEGSYGDIGTVVSIEGDGMVSVDTHGEYGICLEKEIDLERIGPIRVVTRREVAPGNYGIVAITKSNKLMIAAGNYDAEQIREAAHILNQMAEALEENGK